MSNELSLMQIDYPSSNVDRTIHFFTEVLGRDLLFRAGELGFVDLGSVRLYVRPVNGAAELEHASVLYLRTIDLNASLEALEERGAAVHEEAHVVARMPDHDLWLAFIKEPDGRLIGLMEERPNAAEA